MSGPLAIAAVTAVLRATLESAIGGDELSAFLGKPPKATALAPDQIDPAKLTEARVNLFLYQVAWNPIWRNRELPAADAAGHRLANPPLAVDLHYLLTAYGLKELDAEGLLGHALQAFHEIGILGRDVIRRLLAPPAPDPRLTLLAASGLAEQVERIKLTPAPLTPEDLSRLWSAHQAPMRPSAAYVASVVLIERAEPTRSALPVRQVGGFVAPVDRPALASVANLAGPREPITAASTLVLSGAGLAGLETRVRVGAAELAPAAQAEDRLTVDLASAPAGGLRAGVQPVQVVRRRRLGAESNVEAIVLRPTITATVEPDPPPAGGGPAPHSGRLRVAFVPPVGRRQRVELLLDPWDPPAPASGRVLAAPADNGVAEGADTASEVRFAYEDVPPGTYTVRARVDGAESPLAIDSNPASPTFGLYTGDPRVDIP